MTALADYLTVKVRRVDLPVLRKAAGAAQLKTLENFIAEVIESAAATFRATKLDTTPEGKWDERDYETANDENLDVHRTVLPKAARQRMRYLYARGFSQTALAQRFNCSTSAIRFALNKEHR